MTVRTSANESLKGEGGEGGREGLRGRWGGGWDGDGVQILPTELLAFLDAPVPFLVNHLSLKP